jgi:hypothetical protein
MIDVASGDPGISPARVSGAPHCAQNRLSSGFS